MSRLHKRIGGLIVAGLLTACSSTLPQSVAVQPSTLPTVTSDQTAAPNATVSTAVPRNTTATAEVATVSGDGPITASMEKLKIDGERYATLGDPNAPVTVVEFSDYG